MAIFKCKMCGGDLNVAEDEKVVECDYCGSKQTVPDSNDEKRINLYNRANRLRISCEFDKAGAIYEQIIAEFPEEAEAYFCLCLCNYGIEYVDDPATAKKIPTCHRASFEKMRKDENYELALENADMSARIVYEDQAREIDRIMGDILSVSKDEEPYDIFICYKETDNAGGRTPDSVLAQDIYDGLTEKGYRVFFSRITLEDKLGSQYEPYIFAALNSAKIMLAVGTDYEYYNAVWVKNEWSRFLKIIAKDKSKVLIPCYKDMDAYDIPNEFKGLQSQDCGKLGFMQDLTRGIDKLFGKNAEAKTVEKVIVQQSGNGATVDSLLKRVFIFLEDGAWNEADEYCEKVLDIDPENAQAYLGKLMAELHSTKKEHLEHRKKPFDDSDNYKKVCRFDEALGKELAEYIDNNNERIEKTVDAIAVALQKKINSNTIKLKALQTEKEKLSELIIDFDSVTNELNTVKQKIKEIAIKSEELQNKRNSLGLFAGKEKKAIDAELSELTNKKNEYEEKTKELSTELCGFSSKTEIENEIAETEQNILSLQKEIEIAKENDSIELSYEEALQELNDAKIKFKFLAKYEKLFFESKLSLSFGRYSQSKYGQDRTPIEWRVLAREENRILVISEYALDCQQYDASCTDVTWKTCSLRKWMNGTFLNNAFSADEQAQIQNTTVSADKNPKYSTNPGNATTDKVFLLSITEVEKYFASDSAGQCKPTKYAVANGAYVNSDNGNCWWWLRSPGNCQDHAAFVYNVGSVGDFGYRVNYATGCVRPALWINLDS